MTHTGSLASTLLALHCNTNQTDLHTATVDIHGAYVERILGACKRACEWVDGTACALSYYRPGLAMGLPAFSMRQVQAVRPQCPAAPACPMPCISFFPFRRGGLAPIALAPKHPKSKKLGFCDFPYHPPTSVTCDAAGPAASSIQGSAFSCLPPCLLAGHAARSGGTSGSSVSIRSCRAAAHGAAHHSLGA
jgi:hypothetical protein